jgi:exoribonuclease-2
MRARVLSCKPGLHQGLGMNIYSQLTSPLRRYIDLISHIQLRAVLNGTAPLDEDTLLSYFAQAENGIKANSAAERASRQHWLCVYLSDKVGSIFDAVYLAQKGSASVFFVTELGLETQSPMPQGFNKKPGDAVQLELKKVNVPELLLVFNASA